MPSRISPFHVCLPIKLNLLALICFNVNAVNDQDYKETKR